MRRLTVSCIHLLQSTVVVICYSSIIFSSFSAYPHNVIHLPRHLVVSLSLVQPFGHVRFWFSQLILNAYACTPWSIVGSSDVSNWWTRTKSNDHPRKCIFSCSVDDSHSSLSHTKYHWRRDVCLFRRCNTSSFRSTRSTSELKANQSIREMLCARDDKFRKIYHFRPNKEG